MKGVVVFMKRILCILSLLLVISSNVFAMDANFWQVFTVPKEFEFQLPVTMVIEENSAYELSRLDGIEQINKDMTLYFIPNKRFNNKKLNAKVVLNIMVNDNAVGYPRWGEKIPFTFSELEKWENDYIGYFADKSLLENTGETFNSVVSSAFILNINGIETINFVFASQDLLGNLIYNFVFDFYNGTHVYSFLVSIPFDELEYWTRVDTDLRDIIRTVRPL